MRSPAGGEYHVRLVVSDPDAYDRFYNIFANPMLWFIQHYLWDLSNAPDIRRNEVEAFEFGYNVVNEDLATAVIEEIEGDDEPVVMVHDYHLYTLPALVRRARPDVFLHHFVHIPWTQPDAWRVLPREDPRRDLLRAARQRHRRLPHALLPAQLPAVLPRPAWTSTSTSTRGVVHFEDREVWVRAYPLPIDAKAPLSVAASRPRRASSRSELLRRRREHLILRVDRADLSKNVLRGFTAFDLFLEQHPEFRERVTFIAQLMPSRTDVPEYAEYLERIEALVAVVNHRHGTPDWMPIELKLARRPRGGRRRLQALRRAARQRDVRRDEPRGQGGAAGQRARRRLDPLGEHRRPRGARRVRADRQPVRHPGAGRLDPRGADDGSRPSARGACAGLKEIVTARDPGDWIDEQLADIREKAAQTAAERS